MRAEALRSLLTLAFLIAVVALTGPSRLRAEAPWREKADTVASYRIRAELLELPREAGGLGIVGNQTIEWRNTSPDRVRVLYFHLYPNAFLNTRSSFLREAARDGWELPDDMEFGQLDVQQIELVSGETLELQFVSPDDGNTDDRTVARVALPREVLPGESVGVRMRFTTSLPRVIARMGRHGSFVMAAQWYPKLGRYLGTESTAPNLREGWYCHQYHRNTEFFADFADYDVELTTRDDLVVGATGERVEETAAAGKQTLRYAAASVVDFAWTAHDRYVQQVRVIDPFKPPHREEAGGDGAASAPAGDPVIRERDRLMGLLGLSEEELTVPPVKVTLLLQPEHADQADRHFEAARVALGLFGMWFGPYPYANLTIVDPAHGARRAGGMEYPQLVTAGTRERAPPEYLQPEGVIVHEIGHQWFMNLLATNEAEEAWLDEGLNTYFTLRALHLRYGPGVQLKRVLGNPLLVSPFYEFAGVSAGWPDLLGLPDWAAPPRMEIFETWRDLPLLTGVRTERYADDPIEPRRRRYLRSAGWDELVRSSWEYVNRRSYGDNAYSRPALFVATLRRTLHAELGRDEAERRFHRAFREYAQRYRFRHPTTTDFLTTFRDATARDLDALVAGLVRSSGKLDYAVESIRSDRPPRFSGWRDEGGRAVYVPPGDDDPDEDDAPKRSEVLVRRRGEVIVPVRLQVTRERGAPDDVVWETVTWDGRERWKRFLFDGDVVAARLHPYREYLQDVDRRNDSRTKDADYRPGVKWGVRFLLWLENAALSYGRFL